MAEPLDLVLPAIAMGAAGSALMDAWSAVLRRRFGIATLGADDGMRAGQTR